MKSIHREDVNVISGLTLVSSNFVPTLFRHNIKQIYVKSLFSIFLVSKLPREWHKILKAIIRWNSEDIKLRYR